MSYLHDDEEDEGDEDVDLRVLPGLGVSDVVELLGDAVLGPRAVVQQRHQRLLLGQLENHRDRLRPDQQINVTLLLHRTGPNMSPTSGGADAWFGWKTRRAPKDLVKEANNLCTCQHCDPRPGVLVIMSQK